MKNENYSNEVVRFNNVSVGYKKRLKLRNVLLLLIAVFSFLSCVTTQENQLIISEQGSFAIGGTAMVWNFSYRHLTQLSGSDRLPMRNISQLPNRS